MNYTNIKTGKKLNEFKNFYEEEVEFYNHESQEIYNLLKEEIPEKILQSEERWIAMFDYDNKTYAIIADGAMTSDGEYIVAELEFQTIDWQKTYNEKGFYQDDNGTVFYFDPLDYLNFTSDNGQDSYDFWLTNKGTLVRDKNDYFVFSEIGIKDALWDAAEHETDIPHLAEKMQYYADETLHD